MSNTISPRGPLPLPVVVGLIVLTVALLGFVAFTRLTQPAAGPGAIESPAATTAGVGTAAPVAQQGIPPAEILKGKDGGIVGPDTSGKK